MEITETPLLKQYKKVLALRDKRMDELSKKFESAPSVVARTNDDVLKLLQKRLSNLLPLMMIFHPSYL